ncbi:MAG: nucleotidyltransferase domain-containing protein [Actinomycetota bacterium]
MSEESRAVWSEEADGSWPSAVIKRRTAERRVLISRAEAFLSGLPPSLGLVAGVVFGSTARGDFNVWSDIDVLVVARHLPARPQDRLSLLLGDAAPGVQPVAWTPEEFARASRKGNPIAREAIERGVVLVGRLPKGSGDVEVSP